MTVVQQAQDSLRHAIAPIAARIFIRTGVVGTSVYCYRTGRLILSCQVGVQTKRDQEVHCFNVDGRVVRYRRPWMRDDFRGFVSLPGRKSLRVTPNHAGFLCGGLI